MYNATATKPPIRSSLRSFRTCARCAGPAAGTVSPSGLGRRFRGLLGPKDHMQEARSPRLPLCFLGRVMSAARNTG